MYYYLNGTLAYNDGAVAVVDCGGVGYKCTVSLNSAKRLGKVGEQVKLFTYLNVKEDALELYGFAQQDEQNCFLMLISISGVGPKAAMAILSVLTPTDFLMAVAASDFKTITQAQGVGAKLAQRIVLELKDKVKNVIISSTEKAVIENYDFENANVAQAIEALCSLGYSRNEARSAVARLDNNLEAQELIKLSLKELMR